MPPPPHFSKKNWHLEEQPSHRLPLQKKKEQVGAMNFAVTLRLSPSRETMETEFPRKQMESTLYMPSMYDSDDDEEDEVPESREDGIKKGRRGDVQQTRRESRYALQRCLAWSQDEPDDDNDRMDAGMSDDSLSSSRTRQQEKQEGNEISNGHSVPRNVIHWEEKVGSDGNLGSILWRDGNKE